MRRFVLFSSGLFLICAILLTGALLAGKHFVEWPIHVSYRMPLPTKPPFDVALPDYVDTFKRQTFLIPLESGNGGSRLITWGAAQYMRPGDPNKINLEVRQFVSVQVARLLINPGDWRLYSRTKHIFYSIGTPLSFVFTATHDGYEDYTLAYVSGTWNVLIECTNDQTLLAFANQYPF